MSHFQIAVLALSLPAGALGRRFAGGLLSQWLGFDITTQPARLAWGAILAGIAYAAGAVWWHALAIIPVLWVGSAAMGMHNAWSMGRTSGRSFWADAGIMYLYGLGCLAPLYAGGLLLGYMPWQLSGAAIFCPVAYMLAWDFPLQAPWLGCYSNDPVHLTDPPPTAELLWGASVGLAVALMAMFP